MNAWTPEILPEKKTRKKPEQEKGKGPLSCYRSITRYSAHAVPQSFCSTLKSKIISLINSQFTNTTTHHTTNHKPQTGSLLATWGSIRFGRGAVYLQMKRRDRTLFQNSGSRDCFCRTVQSSAKECGHCLRRDLHWLPGARGFSGSGIMASQIVDNTPRRSQSTRTKAIWINTIKKMGNAAGST